jgi:uncharacterized protein (TIGR02598 family)
MKSFRIRSAKKKHRGGFSLVEATLSIGLLSLGFLILAPLLALGLKSSRLARNDRATAQIAQTLIEEAKQGSLTPGSTVYLDIQGNTLPSPQTAAYTAQSTSQTAPGSLTRMTLHITPLGAPDRARTYAAVYPTPQ